MKKLSTFLCLIFLMLLFLSSSRFIFFLSYVKSQKAEFRQQVIMKHSGETKEVFFTENQLYRNTRQIEWKENNKELVINGLYHEVLSVKKTGKLYLVILIEDRQENELFSSYFQLNSKAKNALKDISLLLLSQYLENKHTCSLQQYHTKVNFLPAKLLQSSHGFNKGLFRPPCFSLTV